MFAHGRLRKGDVSVVAAIPPKTWASVTGPSHWFRVSHPPQWTHTESDGTIAIESNDGSGVLALNVLWLGAAETPSPGLGLVLEQFPEVRQVKAENEHDFAGLEETLSAEACLAARPTWWKRPFHRAEWRRVHLWGFRSGPLYVVCTLLHDRDYDPELDTIVRMMLRTLELSEDPADPPERFADRVLTLAKKKFPLLEAKLADEFQMTLGDSTMNLFNFYRSYVVTPHRFEEIMLPALTTVVQVQEWGSGQTEPPLQAVRDRIMPMLYPKSVWESKFPDFVGTDWVAGLAVLYVVDESHAYWYIRDDLLRRWNLTMDALHDLAVDNLTNYFDRQPMELAVAGSEEDGPTMLMPSRADSYNTVRLLSQKFLTRMREVVGGNLAVGIPGRDFFVAVSLKADVMVEHVRQKVAEDYQQMDHPLTDRLLLVSADGVSEYLTEEEEE